MIVQLQKILIGYSPYELVTGHELRFNGNTKITDVYYEDGVVSAIANSVSSFDIYTLDNIRVTTNYIINYTPGTLEIDPVDLTITLGDVEIIYDGFEHKATEENATITGLVSLDNIELVTNGSIKNVGKVNTSLVSYEITSERGNANNNYNVTINNGSIEITKRTLRIESDSVNKRKLSKSTSTNRLGGLLTTIRVQSPLNLQHPARSVRRSRAGRLWPVRRRSR